MFSSTAQISHQVCQTVLSVMCVFCDDAILESAGKLRKLWDSLSELHSSLCERLLEITTLRPVPFSVKTAQFTQFFPTV
jgi:hypothetical protein